METMWFLGITAALSTFGVKAGIGLSGEIYSVKRTISRNLFIIASALSFYGALFLVGNYLLDFLQKNEKLGVFADVLKMGGLMHLLVAGGMLTWGVALLRRHYQSLAFNNENEEETKILKVSSLFLILPCPVCAVSMLLLLWFSRNLMGDEFASSFCSLIFTGIFAGIAGITIIFFFPFRRKLRYNGAAFAGCAMIFIGLYFFLLMLISSNYQSIMKVYEMALLGNSSASGVNTDKWGVALAGIVMFLVGLTCYWVKEQRCGNLNICKNKNGKELR